MFCKLATNNFFLQCVNSRLLRSHLFRTSFRKILLEKSDKVSEPIPCIFNRCFVTKHITHQEVQELQVQGNFASIDKYFQSAVTGFVVSPEKDVLCLNFDNGSTLDFPVIWLRDNCQCVECFEPISNSRVIDFQAFNEDVTPSNIFINGENINIVWSDGHESHFTKEWLCERSFNKNHQCERTHKRHIQPVLWKAVDFLGTPACKTYSFTDIIHNDKVLLEWLQSLATYGVAHISGTPSASGQVKRIAERVAFLRKTHYGSEFYVKGAENASNVAYKTGPLQLHTDLPYYDFVPGVILLHCIRQSSSGGENILTDGFNAAKMLPARQYRILADTVVDWVDIGSQQNVQFFSINRSPVICEDRFGNLEKINWSQPQRDSVFNVTIPRAIEWYKSVKEFSRILHDKENAVQLKTQPGDILSFDNRRILHGRTNYTDGRRLLIGGYLDWDEIYSKIRVLKDQCKSGQ